MMPLMNECEVYNLVSIINTAVILLDRLEGHKSVC